MKLPELKDIKKVAHLYPFVVMVGGVHISTAHFDNVECETEWRANSHRLS